MGFQINAMSPTFNVGTKKFALAVLDDGEVGISYIVAEQLSDGTYQTWGGAKDETGWIVEYPFNTDYSAPPDENGNRPTVIDSLVKQYGSLRNVLQWLQDEAVIRAKKRVAIPIPNPASRLERMYYHIHMSCHFNQTTGKFDPLPPQLIP